MFKYKGKEYETVWFTSDEHYGSERHIQLSGRIDFNSNIKKEKIYRDKEIPKGVKHVILNSVYGTMTFSHDPKTVYDDFKEQMMDRRQYGIMLDNVVNAMCYSFIMNHNDRVHPNDIVFHVGDFGYYGYAEFLTGNHVLVMGNYEYKECTEKFNDNIEEFRNYIISNYNFIDVIEDYMLDTTSLIGFKNIGNIYITHEPLNCLYDRKNKTYVMNKNNELIMNLFGHIHEKCKIKKYGLNVGVDCNHYYPISIYDIAFYFNAILNHYDENVFE
jgi:calcineurin-like phosphoesterase family protein